MNECMLAAGTAVLSSPKFLTFRGDAENKNLPNHVVDLCVKQEC